MVSIKKLFAEISRTYELANHVLTLGLDGFWRKKAAQTAAQGAGKKWLDVCSGTGQMALRLRSIAKEETMIVALDFCLPMLRELRHKTEANRILLCAACADRLPFADNTFDLVTISFATRNINMGREILLRHFQEFRRVLKPDGQFINLETSQPPSMVVRRLFHFYVRLVVKPIGYLISGSKVAYAYLSHTIPRFFPAQDLSGIIYQAGFRKVNSSYLTSGISAIHIAIK